MSHDFPRAEVGDYVVKFGQFRGKRLRDVPKAKLRTYVQYLKEEEWKLGKRFDGHLGEFIVLADKFLRVK